MDALRGPLGVWVCGVGLDVKYQEVRDGRGVVRVKTVLVRVEVGAREDALDVYGVRAWWKPTPVRNDPFQAVPTPP